MLYYKSFWFHVLSFTSCVHMFQYVVLASFWPPIPTYVLTASWPLFKACHHNHWSVHLLSNCRQMSKYITERMVSVTLNQRAIHIHFHLYPWKVMLNGMMFCFAGAASVVIALTDGELNDYQFVTAQQEASTQASDVAIDVPCFFLAVINNGMCSAPELTVCCPSV